MFENFQEITLLYFINNIDVDNVPLHDHAKACKCITIVDKNN